MWEKKTNADGDPSYGNPHDVDNLYAWSASGQLPDGSAFTQFLGELNNCTSLLGNGPLSGGFAGYCDWRLPTYAELWALLDEDPLQCPAVPCVDPFLLPTAVSGDIFGPRYWSSIAVTTDPTRALAVGFDYTDSFGPKTTLNYVRAVRSNVKPTAQP